MVTSIQTYEPSSFMRRTYPLQRQEQFDQPKNGSIRWTWTGKNKNSLYLRTGSWMRVDEL